MAVITSVPAALRKNPFATVIAADIDQRRLQALLRKEKTSQGHEPQTGMRPQNESCDDGQPGTIATTRQFEPAYLPGDGDGLDARPIHGFEPDAIEGRRYRIVPSRIESHSQEVVIHGAVGMQVLRWTGGGFALHVQSDRGAEMQIRFTPELVLALRDSLNREFPPNPAA